VESIKRLIKPLFKGKRERPRFLTKFLFMNTDAKFINKCVSDMLDRDDIVLDVGAGTFQYTRYQDVKALFGIDLPNVSDEGLGWTRNKLRHLPMQKGLYSIFGDCERLPFRSDSFNKIVMIEVVEHIKRDNLAVLELARVLKQDGKLFITTPNGSEVKVDNPYHHRHYTQESLKFLLEQHFKNVDIRLKFPNSTLLLKQYQYHNKFSIRRFLWHYLYLAWFKLYGEQYCNGGYTLVALCSNPARQ